MAWRSIGQLAGDVMQRAEIAAAGSVEALNPCRGIGGDEPSGGRSPSPMHASREGGAARAIGILEADRNAGGVGCEPRPGQPAFLPANRVDANRSMTTVFRRRPAKNRPRGSAVVIDMFVWKEAHQPTRSGARRVS